MFCIFNSSLAEHVHYMLEVVSLTSQQPHTIEKVPVKYLTWCLAIKIHTTGLFSPTLMSMDSITNMVSEVINVIKRT